LLPGLPPHIFDRISPAASERDNAVGHIARTWPSGFARGGAGIGRVQTVAALFGFSQSAHAIAGAGFSPNRGSGVRCLGPAPGTSERGDTSVSVVNDRVRRLRASVVTSRGAGG